MVMQMDAGFTLIVKYSEWGFPKKCSSELSRKELVALVLAKWNGIKQEEVFLSYDLLGAGELDLADDDDLRTMFRLMEESHSGHAHIFVRKVSNVEGNDMSNVVAQSVVEAGEGSNMANGAASAGVEKFALGRQRLLKEEWRKLIVGPGQRFAGGAVEFRRHW